MPKIQMRRDTAANWKSVNPVLLSGEWALETDTRKMKIGDGVTPYNTLEYFREDDNEWVKPDDWIDIRSGALPNSVYFLVGHSADYQTYPTFAITAVISNSGTYDVFVDGIKQATTSSGTETTLTWATLALTSGYDTTYPSSLRTHIVRVTPSSSSNKFERLQSNNNAGMLWAHFVLDNVSGVSLNQFASSNAQLEAITSANGSLYVNKEANTVYSLHHFASGCSSLKTIPIIDFSLMSHPTQSMYNAFSGTALKKIHLRNCKGYASGGALSLTFQDCSQLKEIICENCNILGNELANPFYGCTQLEYIPQGINYSSVIIATGIFTQCTSLKETVLDFSQASSLKVLKIGGSSSYRVDGIKGITVSSSAPFNNATAPQLDVSYTGLERSALVALFNSLPTVSNGQTIKITECAGTDDLTLADIQIATDKGWNVDGTNIQSVNSLPYTLPVEFQQ